MSPLGIDISFDPFVLLLLEGSQAIPLGLQVLRDVAWCSLPDILYSPDQREFVGLSFAVDDGMESIAQHLSLNTESARILRYVNSEFLDRYTGFGQLARFEVRWKQANSIHCEPASLFDGYWLGPSDELPPTRYRLMGIPQILEDHDLRWPLEKAEATSI